jgi:Fanconi anemia group M protein
LFHIAKREQEDDKREASLHGDRKPVSLKEQQEYVISAFPLIGPSLVIPILKEFGSVNKFINASEDDLRKVKLLGEKKARAIKDVIDGEWKEFE